MDRFPSPRGFLEEMEKETLSNSENSPPSPQLAVTSISSVSSEVDHPPPPRSHGYNNGVAVGPAGTVTLFQLVREISGLIKHF